MELTRTPDVAVAAPRFVPEDFDPSDPDRISLQVRRLLDRPLENADDLRRWIHDWSEVGFRVQGERARRLTAMNRDTGDEQSRERHLQFLKEILPAWQRHEDRLNRRYLDCPHRAELGPEFAVFDRIKETSARIYREENTELGAKDRGLAARYQEIQGGVTVEFRGKALTVPQCAAKLQDPDRELREEAFLAMVRRAEQERETIDALYDEMLGLRHAMARNAGFDDFVDYKFAELGRFDYTPQDCARFHEAVEKTVVPALRELRDARLERLGLETLRPWDGDVSLFGVAPSRLFENQEDFVALVRRIFRAVDPVFDRDFDVLVRNELLDLMSRPGKAPGGYNCSVDDIGLPFIFYNAVGMRRDLRVLLHEGGHAFHTLATRELPVQLYRSPPTEFAEVASMAMEFFGFERLDRALDEEELREFTFSQFSGVLRVLSSVALVDSFQQWVYRHPGHTREERTQAWLERRERYGAPVDWSGIERYREAGWQAIPHLFVQPLYFVEYGIAQLGALQLWRQERTDHEAAVDGYRRALALGGSRPLPELFEAAGIRFAMDESILADLIPEVMQKLRHLLD